MGKKIITDSGGVERIDFPNSFDFLRLYAALSVVIAHATTYFNTGFLITKESWLKWFSDGVPLFFVLSGYLVYNSFENCIANQKSMKQFFRNRFLRIAPAIYFYTIIITVVLFTMGFFNFKNFSLIWLVSNMILVPIYQPEALSTFGSGALNGSLWTIPVEVSFYFFIPILYIIENRVSKKTMISVLLLTALIGKGVQVFLLSQGLKANLLFNLYSVTFIPNLANFAMGIVMLKYGKSLIKGKHQRSILILAWVFYLLLKFFQREYGIYTDGVIELLTAVPLSYIAIWFGYYLPGFFYKLTKKIGDLSYGIYIWHMPIVNLYIEFNLLNYFHVGDLIVFIVILTTFVVAVASWRFVERPSLRLKKYSIIDIKYQ